MDFLQESGQKLWQFLPLNPPGYGYSPYQCYSAFADNTLLIDLARLADENLLNRADLADPPDFSPGMVEYKKVEEYKEILFRKEKSQKYSFHRS